MFPYLLRSDVAWLSSHLPVATTGILTGRGNRPEAILRTHQIMGFWDVKQRSKQIWLHVHAGKTAHMLQHRHQKAERYHDTKMAK